MGKWSFAELSEGVAEAKKKKSLDNNGGNSESVPLLGERTAAEGQDRDAGVFPTDGA